MNKCPFCGADTRPGDNYCLSCGQRLLPNTPSPLPVQQAQPPMSDAAQDYQDQGLMGTIPPGPLWTADPSAPTVAAVSPDLPTVREATALATAQATLDRITPLVADLEDAWLLAREEDRRALVDVRAKVPR